MNFGQAIEIIRSNSSIRICRSGWNGKGMWLRLVTAGGWTLWDAKTREPLPPPDGAERQLPWIGMKTADGGFVPWLASQTDLLADDWEIVS